MLKKKNGFKSTTSASILRNQKKSELNQSKQKKENNKDQKENQ